MKFPEIPNRRFFLPALCLVFLAGIFLRLPISVFSETGSLSKIGALHHKAGFQTIGFDEALYLRYVTELSHVGLANYPYMAKRYVEAQNKSPIAILPPTRFLYILLACVLHQAAGTGSLASLQYISCLFSILLVFLSLLFAWRLAGAQMALCVAALMSCAPTQIHMAQFALIDGFFAFWATLSIWLLWENLQRPNNWGWLTCYTLSLALLVLTKENALFAYVALVALLIANHWFRFGRGSRLLVLLTFVGPLIGVAILVTLCGSLRTVIQIYSMLVAKASVTPYAVLTGDGPWYRYIFDLLLVSPVVLILAIGGAFSLRSNQKAGVFLLGFVVVSYLLMANVRYGMNLRYANMWDMPLRFLAIGGLIHLGESLRRPVLWLTLSVTAVCLIEVRQYWIFFVQHDLYELITLELLRAINIVK